MKFEIVTLFPDFFALSLRQSLLGKALEKKLFEIEIINLRDFAIDRHRTVDDRPFGGGAGMVLKLEPIDRCLKKLGYRRRDSGKARSDKHRIILTSAAGVRFEQQTAVKYSLCERLTIVCGHYLGVDNRLVALYDVDEISIGDFVLSGGEPAAVVLVDAVTRLIPGVLGDFESALSDSHMDRSLGTPYYTRPAEYEGLPVPEVLLSGDHKEIEKFRRVEAIRRCLRNRPDLLEKERLTNEELKMIDGIDNNGD